MEYKQIVCKKKSNLKSILIRNEFKEYFTQTNDTIYHFFPFKFYKSNSNFLQFKTPRGKFKTSE